MRLSFRILMLIFKNTFNYYDIRCINMNFHELEKFRKNLINRKRSITTEETTKISLILPLFRILGYDTENPDEVKAEYACDVWVKTSEKVDLVILIGGEVKMLVECKVSKNKTQFKSPQSAA